jgi:Tfp pilus assembly protein PilZ
VYLKLSDDNGGILLNLGKGGLSLQAVAGLNPGQDLVLRFGLFDREEALTVSGRVVWLGPTRKEAGIRFESLSESTEQTIARWIATEETGSHTTEWKAASAVNPVPATTKVSLPPPPQVSAAPIPAVDPQSYRSTPLPSDLLLGVARPDLISRRPGAPLSFGTRFSSPIPMNSPNSEEHSAGSTASPTEVPSEQTILDPELPRLSWPGIELRKVDRALPDRPTALSQADAGSRYQWILSMLTLSSPEGKQHLQVLIVAGLAVCLGIFIPISIATSRKHSEKTTSAVSAPLTTSHLATTAADANSAVETALRPQGTQDPSAAKTLSVPAAPFSVVSSSDSVPAPSEFASQPPETSWLATLKMALLGVDDKPMTLDPAIAGVPVWTDQWSGFYYCASTPYFVRPLRVSVLRQGDALQSGFQPKLGSYCH